MFWGQFAEDGNIARYNPHLFNLDIVKHIGVNLHVVLAGVDHLIFKGVVDISIIPPKQIFLEHAKSVIFLSILQN
jgi:hypothetical protein